MPCPSLASVIAHVALAGESPSECGGGGPQSTSFCPQPPLLPYSCGMSAGCETAYSGYETHEESFLACSLLFTALTSSEASTQERFLPSSHTGFLVVPLQWVTHSQLTQLPGTVCACGSVKLCLSSAVGHWPCRAAGGACPWLFQDRGENFWPKMGYSVSPAVRVLRSEVHEVCLGLLAGCL